MPTGVIIARGALAAAAAEDGKTSSSSESSSAPPAPSFFFFDVFLVGAGAGGACSIWVEASKPAIIAAEGTLGNKVGCFDGLERRCEKILNLVARIDELSMLDDRKDAIGAATDYRTCTVRQTLTKRLDEILADLIAEALSSDVERLLEQEQSMVSKDDRMARLFEHLLCEIDDLIEERHDLLAQRSEDLAEDVEGGDAHLSFGCLALAIFASDFDEVLQQIEKRT